MRVFLRSLGVLLICVLASHAATPDSPVGVWQTIDDKTGKPRGVVRIYFVGDRLFGRLEQSLLPGSEHRVCVPCTDERKNQPVIGLIIIRNMRQDGREYDGGDILDPETGAVYRCRFHFEERTVLAWWCAGISAFLYSVAARRGSD